MKSLEEIKAMNIGQGEVKPTSPLFIIIEERDRYKEALQEIGRIISEHDEREMQYEGFYKIDKLVLEALETGKGK